MAHLGHPLLGDGLYGGDVERMPRHALHCARLAFPEPGAGEAAPEKQVFSASLPADMRAALCSLGIVPPG